MVDRIYDACNKFTNETEFSNLNGLSVGLPSGAVCLSALRQGRSVLDPSKQGRNQPSKWFGVVAPL